MNVPSWEIQRLEPHWSLGHLVLLRVETHREHRLSFRVVKTELNSIIRRLIGVQVKIPACANELGDSDALYDQHDFPLQRDANAWTRK